MVLSAASADLLRAWVADREGAGPLGVSLCGVARAAGEAVVLPPAERHRHVLGGEVVATVLLDRPDDHQRGDHEGPPPELFADRQGPVGRLPGALIHALTLSERGSARIRTLY
jgi:hypothetical protein